MEREDIVIEYPVIHKEIAVANIGITGKEIFGSTKCAIRDVFTRYNKEVFLCIQNYGNSSCYVQIGGKTIEVFKNISVIPLGFLKNTTTEIDVDIEFPEGFNGFVYAIGVHKDGAPWQR